MPAKTDEPVNGTVAPTAPLREPLKPRLVAPVPIELDKQRHLRMDFKAMNAFEKKTGLSAWSSEAWTQPNPMVIGTMIWAALLHEDPDLSFDDAMSLPGMEMANMAYLSDRVGELWGNDMPAADPAVETTGAERDPNPPTRRAG